MSPTNKAKTHLLALLLLLTAWGCERGFPTAAEADLQPSPQLEAEMECMVGNLAGFGLNVDYTTLYEIEIPPPPSFHLIEDCMCRMDHVQLDFDSLPEANQIIVLDENWDEVPFSGPTVNAAGDYYIRIEGPDLVSPFYVDFVPGIGFNPTLVKDGGFCLIDNISGPFPSGNPIHNKPYLRVDPNTFKNEMWIPTIMTAIP